MKKNLTLILFFLSQLSIAQNLIQNSSFESYTSCPTQNGQVDSVINWFAVKESPDYYNSCTSIATLSVPSNQGGYQQAHSGDAYCGMICSYSSPNGREFIGTQVSNTLVISQQYFISFYLSLSGGYSFKKACNKFGCKLSTIPFIYDSLQPNNQAIFFSDSVITDTTNWVFIKGSFIADSAYNFIAFGNFFDDNHTDTFSLNYNGFYNSYYYIDDVCLSSDSLLCNLNTGINNFENVCQITIYPNPATDVINIRSKIEIKNLIVYNSLGNKIKEEFFTDKTNQLTINCSSWKRGVYLIKINNVFFKQLIFH